MDNPVFTSIRENNEVLFFSLLKKEVLEITDAKETTPLMCASSNGNEKFVCLLV
jgi:hypothetical protein